MAAWIDFKELRARLRLAELFAEHHVELKVIGERATGLCPLPTHTTRTSGKRTGSFSAHLGRNVWQCFGCKASGNALDFAIYMAEKDPTNPDDVRAVALRLVERLGGQSAAAGPKDGRSGGKRRRGAATTSPLAPTPAEPPATVSLPVVVNGPLDFTLKHLDADHPYLRERGFTPDTVEYFGLGYCVRGLLKDRVAIPLHDSEGRLVGYAGRLVDDDRVSDECPKYLLPGPRDREGKRYELHKSELLYNAHRVARPADNLIVVEGFPSAWWLHQHGHPDVVALMGGNCSDTQASLIADLLADDGTLFVLTDGDDAGRRCGGELFVKLGHRRRLRHAKLDDGEQPTDLTGDELDALLC
jgi:DNA primase